MITLLVGKKKNPFHVHMDMLCAVSPFFKSAFMGAGTFKETSERLMTLPKDRSKTIDRMVQWLYSKKVPYDRNPPVTDSEVDLRDEYQELVMLYVTADKFGVVTLKNDIIDILYDLHVDEEFELMDNIIRYIYRETPDGSSLRRLIVDWYVWHADPKAVRIPGFQRTLRRCPDFAAELVTRLVAKGCGRQDPWLKSSRRFHEAAEGPAEDNSGESDISDQSSGTTYSDESSIGDESSF